MKKSYLIFVLILLVCSIMIFVTSCTKEQQSTPSQSNTIIAKDVSPGDIIMPEIEIPAQPELNMASIDKEFSMVDPVNLFDKVPEIQIVEKTVNFLGNDLKVIEIVKFINSLKLSHEQLIKFKTMQINYWNCKNEQHLKLLNSNHEILVKANNSRKELITKFKAGEITEVQFKQELKELYDKTIAAIKDNPVRAIVIENLKKCYKSYVENVKLLLNSEQWAKWVIWQKNQ